MADTDKPDVGAFEYVSVRLRQSGAVLQGRQPGGICGRFNCSPWLFGRLTFAIRRYFPAIGQLIFAQTLIVAISLTVLRDRVSAQTANGLVGTGQTTSSAADPDLYDRATLVILAPNGPVIADLRISVAKLPYRQWVGQFLAKQLDVDRSGELNLAELDLLTTKLRALLAVRDAREVLRLASTGRESESVPAGMFAEWVRYRLPQEFAISALPKTADDAVQLSSLLDRNQDGAVSEEELHAAADTLRFRDLDDDQTFSIAELLPYRDPRTQNRNIAPDVASLPFFEVLDAASANRAADRILSRYGTDLMLNSPRLRSASKALSEQSGIPGENASGNSAALNADNNSSPQASLTALLLNPDFHMVIDVRLSDLANRSDVTILLRDHAVQFCDVDSSSSGMVRLVVDGMPVVFAARGGGANNRAYLRGFLGQNFLMYDVDRNQYLDESEFNAMSALIVQAGAAADFAAVDRNHDGMVVREELFAYVERELAAAASQIEVTVEQDGKTLFGLLDANQDRRLSPRELMEGFERIRPYDVSGDGRLANDELGIEYNVTVGLGRSEIRRTTSQNMAAMQMRSGGSGDAILPGTASRSGPEWFQRMDRNQDGDVSRREFIGTAAMFSELDLNGDQLISSDEALAISTPETDE